MTIINTEAMKDEIKQILDNSSMGTEETEAVYNEILKLFNISGRFIPPPPQPPKERRWFENGEGLVPPKNYEYDE